MATLNLIHLNGTPAFVLPATDPNYARVHAAIHDKKNNRWLFPAYLPFGQAVIDDLKKVDKTLAYSDEVVAHLAYLADVPRRIKDRELPPGFQFHTKPFDHQLQMLATLLHYPRFAILWEPGCGKSKVPVDHMIATPGQRMLIFSQKVTLENWVEQVTIHGGGKLRAAALVGSAENKRSVIENYKDYDVIVASYGTARTMGLPRLHKKTLAFIQDLQAKGKVLTTSGLDTLVKTVRRMAEPEDQIAHVQMWADGTSFADLGRVIEKEVKQKAQWLDDIEYQRCLVDESQNIKEITSQQTKTIIELGKKAGLRYVMSGTPTMGDPRHLYPQMRFLSPAIFPEDWMRFSDMFLVRSPYNARIVTGYKNLNLVNARVQKISDSKKKEDCLDLPPRVISDIFVNLTKAQTKLYNSLVSSMGVDLGAFFTNPTGNVLEVQNAATLLNKLGQVTSGFVLDNGDKSTRCNGCAHLSDCVSQGILPYTSLCKVVPTPLETTANYLPENPKLDALEELLDTLLEDPTRKVIIWAYYRAELDQIEGLIDKKNLGMVRMDGSSSGSLQKRISRFNNDPDCRVYLGQVATGVGITLNAATYMIYYCLDWSLGTYLQSIDRNYRAGQTQKVTVYRLIARNTVEEYKAKALDQKKDLSAVMTNRLACTSCSRRFDCLRDGIELFDPGCVYQRSAKRSIARAEILK